MSATEPIASSPQGPNSSPADAAPNTGLPEEFVLTPEYVEEEAIRGDIVLRGAVLLLAVLFGWTQLSGTALLTRIRTGQELASHGFLPPRTDTFFSYTATENPWINLSWLGDLCLAGLFGVGGGALLSIVSGAAAGVAFWLVGRTSLRGVSTWWGSLCAGLAVVAVFPLLTPGPTLWTVLGLAITLYLLHRGLETPHSRWWWGIAPTLLIWTNLDPRAYLGLLLLVLYLVGQWLNPPAGEQPSTKPLLVAVIAGLINPFPLEVLRSPVTLIQRFHPLWLEYGGGNTADYGYLWRPVTDDATWTSPSWHLIAAVALAVLMLLTLLLNRRRLHWGELLAVLGLNVLGLASGVDFTAVAVVNAVVAGLNAQRWYRATCRQEYTLDRQELLFSRAGRAITVLALFAAAYWGVSGWMTGAAGRRIGFGFSLDLEQEIAGYGELLGKVGVDQFDDHPFHITPAQGDLLIWHGRKSFTDSRLLVFAPVDGVSWLEQQRQVAAALRSPDQPLTTSEAINEWTRGWRETFDQFSVSHVVVPLTSPAGYALWINLASQGLTSETGEVTRFWMPAGIRGPAAVLYRLDRAAEQNSPEFVAFLSAKGEPSIVQETFRHDDPGEWTRRGVFPRGPTYYETSLLLPQPVLPNEALVARHYAMRLGAAQRSLFETVAYCHQIIRHARRGLVADPNSFETYLLLGEAYQRLWRAEMSLTTHRLGLDAADRRFLQAVAAYHHAAQCRPAAVEPHALLYPLYLDHGDYDLALRHLDRIHELTGRYTLLPKDDPNYDASFQQSKRLRGELAAALKSGQDAVDKARIGGLESSVRAALQSRCSGYALELLEQDLTLTISSPELAQNYGRLLMMNGRTLDAMQQLENQLRNAESSPAAEGSLQSLRPLTALSNLGADEYDRAADLWEEFGQQRLKTVTETYLVSMPGLATPGMQGDGWPVFQIMTAAESLGRWIPDWELTQWQIAMTELESGHNTAAVKLLEQVLSANPQSLLRPQIALYLTLLTGQSVEPSLPAAAESRGPPDRPPSPALPVRPSK